MLLVRSWTRLLTDKQGESMKTRLLMVLFALGLVSVMSITGCERKDDGDTGEAGTGVVPTPGKWTGRDISFTVNAGSTAITQIHWVFRTPAFTETHDMKGSFAIENGTFGHKDYSGNTSATLSGTFDHPRHATIRYGKSGYSQTYTATP